MRSFVILLHPEPHDGGYSVTLPALPGCFTQGETAEEAVANAHEAIELHLEALEADGQPIPDSDATAELATVEVG